MCRLAKPKWETKTINLSNMIQLQPEKQIDCLIVATPWQPFFFFLMKTVFYLDQHINYYTDPLALGLHNKLLHYARERIRSRREQ